MNRVQQVSTAVATSFEFVLAICLLVVFASAYPDRYRTVLWREGGSKSWNLDPNYRTYSWANCEEVSPMPILWDERSAQYSLCAAIITMFLWVVRLCIRGLTLDIYSAVVSNLLYDIMLVALWSYSVVIESSEAWPSKRAGCKAAKASFGLAIFAVLWFSVRCVATCMYGAYMYDKSYKDADIVNVGVEKSYIQLPSAFGRDCQVNLFQGTTTTASSLTSKKDTSFFSEFKDKTIASAKAAFEIVARIPNAAGTGKLLALTGTSISVKFRD